MSVIIKARELSRWYGVVMGLNHVEFDIYPGLTGLVGPNGAGKSTLIQIITGQLKPSSGSLEVFGEVPWNNPPVLGRIGFCPEHEAVHQDLKPRPWLASLGVLSGLSPAAANQRAKELLNRVGLPQVHWGKRLATFSKGMRQRVKLAQALMHRPDLLVLDEPMNGLDPMGRQEVAQVLKELAAEGVSALISSHILPELESLCAQILILNWSKVFASGSQSTIRKDIQTDSEVLNIRCDNVEKLARYLFDQGWLLGFDMDMENHTLNARIKNPGKFQECCLDTLLDSGVTIHEMRCQSRSLQDIFRQVTQ